MNNLVSTLGDLSQVDEAISLLEETVRKMRRIHGDQHFYTKVAVNNLARYSAAITSKAEYNEVLGSSDGKTSSFFARESRRNVL
jgi:hypothetical protein